MPDETETSSSDEPDPATPRWRRRLARLWNSGIPLWQKLLVWAGAAGVAWTTTKWFSIARIFRNGVMPHEPLPPASDSDVYIWYASGLTLSAGLSAGLWLWPLARGRWRNLAVILAAPPTLVFLILVPHGISSMVDILSSRPVLADIEAWASLWTMPMLAGTALAIVWIQVIRDSRASRRA